MVGADDSGLRWWCDTDYDVPITFSSMDVSLLLLNQFALNSPAYEYQIMIYEILLNASLHANAK